MVVVVMRVLIIGCVTIVSSQTHLWSSTVALRRSILTHRILHLMYVCECMCVCMRRKKGESSMMYVYMYVCMYVSMYVCMYEERRKRTLRMYESVCCDG